MLTYLLLFSRPVIRRVQGDVYIVEAGAEFKLIGINKMNEICMATPAISRGTLFFRTRHHLVAVAADKQ